MKNKNHPSETLPIDNSCQTGLPLLSGGVFIMKEIQLSKEGKNRGKYVALVDDEDYEYLNQWRWNVAKYGRWFYAARNIVVKEKQFTIRMHCVIMNRMFIDHIDNNGLNNQKSNLRLCTRSENGMNRSKQLNCSSVFKGVYFYKNRNKWLVRIGINKKGTHVGYFDSEIDAAKAYNQKAIELFGEFAKLNNINSKY